MKNNIQHTDKNTNDCFPRIRNQTNKISRKELFDAITIFTKPTFTISISQQAIFSEIRKKAADIQITLKIMSFLNLYLFLEYNIYTFQWIHVNPDIACYSVEGKIEKKEMCKSTYLITAWLQYSWKSINNSFFISFFLAALY